MRSSVTLRNAASGQWVSSYYGYGYRRYGYYGDPEAAALRDPRRSGGFTGPENGQALRVAPDPRPLERPAEPGS